LREDGLADPEGERVRYEGRVHFERGGKLCYRLGDRLVIRTGYSRGLGGLEGVDDAGLPGVDVGSDEAVRELQLDGDLAERWEPRQFARRLEGFETGGVAGLEGSNFRGWFEGFGMEGGPEEPGQYFGG
jgi:hypothetical protein